MFLIRTGRAAALALLCRPAAAGAETFYVDAVQGHDEASGRSADAAFHSFAKAVAALAPGDRLVIRPGLYQETLHVTVSGTAAAPIEIQGASGARPQLRAAEDAVVIDADYIHLSHIDAVGTASAAIRIQPSHHHVTVADTVAHDSGLGGIVANQTDYLSILHNEVYGNSRTSPWQGSGISLYQATNSDDKPGFHNVIAGNIAHDNRNETPDPKLPPASQGRTTDGNGIIIDDFRHSQAWLGKKTPPYTAETLVENNLTYRNGGRGIHVFFSDRVMVRNNTCAWDVQDRHLLGDKFGEIDLASAGSVQLVNNLVVPRAGIFGFFVSQTTGLDADYNVTIGTEPRFFFHASSAGWGVHNMIGQHAGFRDATESAGADFHLGAGSDAIGHGDAKQAPARDLDGQARQAGDVGAYRS